MEKIHIGTSGWSYKGWIGAFYPEGMKSTDWLAYYAKHFSTTEINSSFYHQTKPSTITKWLKKVPPGFLFCPKMSRYLTHMKKLHDPEESLRRFFEAYHIMKDHIGQVLIQLPASLHFHEETVLPFYKLLKEKYSDYSFALEVRHTSWFSAESIELMKQYDITLVIAQSERFPYHETITARDIYLRFHGPKALYGSSYDDDTLKSYAAKIVAWEKQKHIIWAFFNNDINGHALENAGRLKRFIAAIKEE